MYSLAQGFRLTIQVKIFTKYFTTIDRSLKLNWNIWISTSEKVEGR